MGEGMGGFAGFQFVPLLPTKLHTCVLQLFFFALCYALFRYTLEYYKRRYRVEKLMTIYYQVVQFGTV